MSISDDRSIAVARVMDGSQMEQQSKSWGTLTFLSEIQRCNDDRKIVPVSNLIAAWGKSLI